MGSLSFGSASLDVGNAYTITVGGSDISQLTLRHPQQNIANFKVERGDILLPQGSVKIGSSNRAVPVGGSTTRKRILHGTATAGPTDTVNGDGLAAGASSSTSGVVNITFSTSFASAPTVVVSAEGALGANKAAKVVSVTTTGCTVQRMDGLVGDDGVMHVIVMGND